MICYKIKIYPCGARVRGFDWQHPLVLLRRPPRMGSPTQICRCCVQSCMPLNAGPAVSQGIIMNQRPQRRKKNGFPSDWFILVDTSIMSKQQLPANVMVISESPDESIMIIVRSREMIRGSFSESSRRSYWFLDKDLSLSLQRLSDSTDLISVFNTTYVRNCIRGGHELMENASSAHGTKSKDIRFLRIQNANDACVFFQIPSGLNWLLGLVTVVKECNTR